MVGQRTEKKETKYYEIVQQFRQGEVTEYNLNLGTGVMIYKLGDDVEYRYVVPNVEIFLNDVHVYVTQYNIENSDAPIKYDYKRGSNSSLWASMLPTMLVSLLVVVALFYMYRKMGQNIMNENNRTLAFGKARVKLGKDEKRKTTFKDVAGADEEKEELAEIVEFLRTPETFRELGARIPKGVLLVGPPGTGKTLLARAVAGEAGVPFFSISGSDFVEMYVGVGASRVRDLFSQAKKNSPSILFIDEIDAVGRHRGAGMGGGHDEREQTLNQLLIEMDGFGENEGVIIIAATNRPDILDPALLRPGRFDRQLTVGYPDVKGREEILKVHARNKPIAPDVKLSVIAQSTAGFTGADLENLLNEAALLSARRKKKAITMEEIEEATVKCVVGTEKKSRKISDKEKKLTAYHEAGHALATYFLPGQDPVHQISIIPRGMAGGYTMSLPSEDKSYRAKGDMLDDIVVLLGGRVAEATVLGDISTGASNDIERATDIARKMVTRYGMSESLGPIVYGSGDHEVFLGKDYGSVRNYSETVAADIDAEVKKIIASSYDRCEEIIRSNIDKLTVVAEYLIINEKVDGAGFEKLMKGESLAEEKAEDIPEEKSADSSVAEPSAPAENENL
ncbi:MAG: ATP-dependent zinc metalloprotease FtsH [Clostridia bacterium]|nr:ATP-dependent zinc metalloprotease FtsH [Oscillospiraceae bacterium]MBQ7005276.1 ATP-dependent zinc metalloprotease FtsH [Clostridia bacterium]